MPASAPTAVKFGIRGFVKAFNADDGKLLWTFLHDPGQGPRGRVGVNDATGRNMKRDIEAEKAQSRRTRRSTRRSAAACG
jgi:hypothetical protein